MRTLIATVSSRQTARTPTSVDGATIALVGSGLDDRGVAWTR